MGADALAGMGITPAMSEPNIWAQIAKMGMGGMQGLEQAQKLQKLSQGPEMQAPPIARPQGGGGGGNELQQLSSLFANPVGQEQLKRLLRMQGLA